MRFHDVVILTDGDDVPLVRGVTIDGHELIVPSESTVNVGAAASGTMTVTFTVFARSVNTTESQAYARLRYLQEQPDE